MILNLKSLNESLEKMTTHDILDESQTLIEKYSDDMPEWLKKRLLTLEHGHRQDTYHAGGSWNSENRRKKNPRFGSPDSYSLKRGENRFDKWDLFYLLKQNGFDLNNLKVIEDTFNGKNDIHLQDPYIPVFLMDSNQVWIKGLNDNEVYSYTDDKANYVQLPFRAVPQKYLFRGIKSFAYIDTSDKNNYMRDKAVARENEKRDTRNKAFPLNTKDAKYNGLPIHTAGIGRKDKSGYLINPDKYKKKLFELTGSSLVYNKLHECYEELEEAKTQISNIILNSAVEDASAYGSEVYAAIFNIFPIYRKAADRYVLDMKNLDNAVANDNTSEILAVYDDATKKERFGLANFIEELKRVSRNYFSVLMDWD